MRRGELIVKKAKLQPYKVYNSAKEPDTLIFNPMFRSLSKVKTDRTKILSIADEASCFTCLRIHKILETCSLVDKSVLTIFIFEVLYRPIANNDVTTLLRTSENMKRCVRVVLECRRTIPKLTFNEDFNISKAYRFIRCDIIS